MTLLRRLALGFPANWAHRRPCSLSSLARVGSGPYFISWDPGSGVYGEDWNHAPRDDRGVLLSDRHYHPIRIAQFALHRFDVWYKDRDANAYADFMAQATWLRDHQERGAIPGLYRFDFPWEKYGAKRGWVSAMAQGEAISVLLRAESVWPNNGFEQAAMLASVPFFYDVSRGGVVWDDGSDLFFEEIANDHAPHVLNGCIFALWGLWELWVLQIDKRQGELVERCVRTLRRWLHRYDTGWWTRYSLLRTASGRSHMSTLKYHAFHAAQMRVLGEMFDEPLFRVAADRWTAYMEAPQNRARLIGSTLASLPARLLHRDTVRGGAHT